MLFLKLSQNILLYIPKYISKVSLKLNNYNVIKLTNPKFLHSLVFFLKYSSLTQFSTLLDICAIDHLRTKLRFELIYNFSSIFYNMRLFVTSFTNKEISSITSIFSNAGWLEREVFDMFGIFFFNNLDLRRILTDYGFSEYPLRKTFPVWGYKECFYDIKSKKIVYRPVQFSQKTRETNETYYKFF